MELIVTRDLTLGQDQKAFGKLYCSYSNVLLAEIIRMVKSKETAEDLLQDVFITIWQKGHQYNPTKGSLYTWMISITRNRCIDYLRKPKFGYQCLSHDLTKDISIERPNRKLEMSLLFKRLKQLRPLYVELIRLIYVYGYTYEEASKQCQIPVGTVKTILRKIILKSKIQRSN